MYGLRFFSLQKPLFSGLLLAVLFLLLGNLFATGADGFVKSFPDVSGIYQYLFLRQVLLLMVILPFFLRQPKAERRLKRGRVQLVRANLTAIGGACVVVAVSELSLATANVLFYASPVLTLVLAAWWFKEPLHKHRIINIVCCFIGVIVAMRPDSLGPGILAGLAAAVCIACYNLLVRFIPDNTSTVSIMFWGTALSLPLITCLALFDWRPLNIELFYLVLGSALCLCAYQLCCILAYRKAEAGAIAVAEYSGLVFAAFVGWYWFAESLEIWTLAGMVLIILPILWQTWKEQQRHSVVEN